MVACAIAQIDTAPRVRAPTRARGTSRAARALSCTPSGRDTARRRRCQDLISLGESSRLDGCTPRRSRDERCGPTIARVGDMAKRLLVLMVSVAPACLAKELPVDPGAASVTLGGPWIQGEPGL